MEPAGATPSFARAVRTRLVWMGHLVLRQLMRYGRESSERSLGEAPSERPAANRNPRAAVASESAHGKLSWGFPVEGVDFLVADIAQ